MTFLKRAIGAARLDIATFEEVEADRHATVQALAVVVMSNTAAGIGLGSGVFDAPVLTLVVLALLMWVFWAALTYGIGVYLIPEPQTETDVTELMRTIGFAAAPGMLRVLGFLPVVGRTVYGLVTAWMLVAMVIAVRQALDYKSTWRALVVCVIAGIAAVAMTALIGGLVLFVAEQLFSEV
jgi:hypothetical protein